MNPLFAAVRSNDTLTANGAVTHSTTGNYLLDFFFAAGASRGMDISEMFVSALKYNHTDAIRILQWMRDIRGGSGERDQFIKLMKVLAKFNPKWANKVLMNTPEVGRWKDVAVLGSDEPSLLDTALTMFAIALRDSNGLAAKWAPRKGYFASRLAKHMGLSSKEYRKLIVGLSNTVEQKMCAKRWDEIEFGKLPSIASSMYQKAFWKNAEEKYREYVSSLVKGVAKVNAGAIFPYSIIAAANKLGTDEGWQFADAQWKSLPDYINGSDRKVLCVVDVSGSMEAKVNSISIDGNGLISRNNKTDNTTCMDVAISLGLYISERTEGPFKDLMITFDDQPEFIDVSGCTSLKQRVATVGAANWGGSTNLARTFELVLTRAVENGINESDMPSDILIMSDMEFNECESSNYYRFNHTGEIRSITNLDKIRELYKNAGYKMPNLIFWNIRCYQKNNPARVNDTGVGLVSGLSPAIMKAILSGDGSDLSPLKLMNDAISDPRYISVE